MKYRLTEAALADVRELTRHIRLVQKSSQNARLVASRLKATFNKLARIPSLGHTREELADDHVLVYPVTGVLVIYNPTVKPLMILRVIHGARVLGKV